MAMSLTLKGLNEATWLSERPSGRLTETPWVLKVDCDIVRANLMD